MTESNGRVWGFDNLRVCDGSLMPTGGGVKPATTILAKAARIGDDPVAMGKRGEL